MYDMHESLQECTFMIPPARLVRTGGYDVWRDHKPVSVVCSLRQ